MAAGGDAAPAGLLAGVRGPEDLRRLAPGQLPALAGEVRERLVEVVSRTGGHLGPNLGVVELTIALHRVFDSPRDALVFDTGHQAYVHKLLTGRQDAFERLRQRGGSSGYPSRAESAHDLVENSHASTALSYADGLAKAAEARGGDRRVVALLGDGALTGGMCWEALNNIGGAPERPVVVVLNDNTRSYAPTVGSVAAHLAQLRAGTAQVPLFEQLGLAYLGPVDGHDVAAVEAALTRARDLRRPVVVHAVTRKGCGHPAAEADTADCMHGISAAAPAAAKALAPVSPDDPAADSGPAPAPARTWTEVFGDELVALADRHPELVAISAAMVRPTGLHRLAQARPGRVHDVGIAEQHAVTSAAGLATGGAHPVVCLYATFLNRAFDQVLMDVALHRLPVTFVLDRAGTTGDDGPSHNGMWDLSLLGIVPGMRVAAPRDEASLRELLGEAVADPGPTAVRFPKGSAPARLPAIGSAGGGDLLVSGRSRDVLLLGAGPMAAVAVEAARLLERSGVGATVVDPRWVLPVGDELVDLAADHGLVVTVEDGGVAGGFGDAVARAVRTAGVPTPVQTLGLPQAFIEQGSRAVVLAESGLDAAGVAGAVRRALGRRSPVRALG